MTQATGIRRTGTDGSKGLRIAVLGGGTAGFMAAVQVRRMIPEAELVHIYDPDKPPLRAGLSSNPGLPRWCTGILNLPLSVIEERCDATIKVGGLFEGWGRSKRSFAHLFQPPGLVAFHFDPDLLRDLLAEHIETTTFHKSISKLERDGEQHRIQLDDDTAVTCDYIFDARGFTKDAEDLLPLDWIPTNFVTVQDGPPSPNNELTRNVARPHGWIFAIPLRSRTQYGYVFNAKLTSKEEVDRDFSEFLKENGVSDTDRRAFGFPSYIRWSFYRGGVFRIGNSASFIEPLEAVSISMIVFQLNAAVEVIRRRLDDGRDIDPGPLNRFILGYSLQCSLFISWHYAAGSTFDTPFWKHAVRCYETTREQSILSPHVKLFEQFLAAARSFPFSRLSEVKSLKQWEQEIPPLMKLRRPFGTFSELNIVQVGRGLGYFEDGPLCD